jgi:hypothetical protein
MSASNQPAVSTASVAGLNSESASAPVESTLVNRHRGKAPAPTKFKGTPQEMVGNKPKTWLWSASQWLQLEGGSTEETMIFMFSTLLEDAAVQWFMNLSEAANRKGIVLTLELIFQEFMDQYYTDNGLPLADLELSALRYGKGQCKTLQATNNEFDRLAADLCRGREYNEATDLLLASRYQQVIRDGNFALWDKANDAQPTTLDEWKEAVKRAYAAAQRKEAALGYSAASNASRTHFNPNYRASSNSHSSPSSSSSASRPAMASVQHVQARPSESDEKGVTWERQEGEQPLAVQSEQLQQVKTRPDGKRLFGSHLTHDQRLRLARAKKCWICYKPGHIAPDCAAKDKGVPRKPTEADLNA